MNRERGSFISTGVSSILMVFVILCLITFAALSLSSADVDHGFSEKTAERTTNYYTAEGRACDILQEIDEILRKAWENSRTEEDYERTLTEEAEKLEGIEVTQTENTKAKSIKGTNTEGTSTEGKSTDTGLRISFYQEIDETQRLAVELAVVYPENGQNFFKVEKWQSVQAEEWDPDMSLPVMQRSTEE